MELPSDFVDNTALYLPVFDIYSDAGHFRLR